MVSVWFWIIFAFWVLVIVYHGVQGAKYSTDMYSYSVPRGKLSAFSLSASTAATQASPATFLGVAGFAFSGGASGLWWLIGVPLAHVIGLTVAAKFFRRTGIAHGSMSVPEWIGSRYNSNVLKLIISIVYLLMLFYIIGQFTGMAHIFSVMADLPHVTGVLIAAVITAIYTILGGHLAVVKTDMAMGLIMAFICIVMGISAFWLFPSLSEIHTGLANQDPNLVKTFNPEFPIFQGLFAVFSFSFFQGLYCIKPYIANRFLMLQDEREFPRYILMSGLFVLLFSLSVFGGIFTRVLEPGLEYPDQANVVLFADYFPPVLAGIFGVGIISAAITTADSVLAAMGTIIGNDIFGRIKSSANTLWIGRIGILIICIIAGVLSIDPHPYIAEVSTIGIYSYLAAAAAPILIALYWKKATVYGGIATAIIGPSSFLYFYYAEVIPNVFEAGTVATLIGFAVMFVVSYLTPSPPVDYVEDFFQRESTDEELSQ